MNHAKKMVLVPEHTLERLERRQNVSTPPLTARLNGLDHDIQDVLKDSKISEDEKVRQYSQALQNYLHYYNERKNQPVHVKLQQTAPPIKETVPTEEVTQETRKEPKAPQADIESEIIHALPKTLKDRGKLLMEKIKENPEIIKWNEKGQLVLEGKAQQGTHISDLIKDSLRASKKENPGPIGSDLFTQGLAKINVPEHLIRNAQRKASLRFYKSGNSANKEPPEEDVKNEWFPTPLPPSPGPIRSKSRNPGKEMRQRWLTFRT